MVLKFSIMGFDGAQPPEGTETACREQYTLRFGSGGVGCEGLCAAPVEVEVGELAVL